MVRLLNMTETEQAAQVMSPEAHKFKECDVM